MIVDGKSIAGEIFREIGEEIESRGRSPRLLVVTAAPNPETQKYLSLKKSKASALGIDMVVQEFSKEVTTEEVKIFLMDSFSGYDGVIVQLPLPPQVNAEEVLALIPAEFDTDMMNYRGGNTSVLPPVVGAVHAIALKYDVDFKNKNVVVIGRGKLVGAPAALWAKDQGALVTVIDKGTKYPDDIISKADIIISGAGVPGLITPNTIKDGVIIFDAGTSEDGGMLKGDASPECAAKSALFTPVPGGIGPITIAVLLRNLVKMSA